TNTPAETFFGPAFKHERSASLQYATKALVDRRKQRRLNNAGAVLHRDEAHAALLRRMAAERHGKTTDAHGAIEMLGDFAARHTLLHCRQLTTPPQHVDRMATEREAK